MAQELHPAENRSLRELYGFGRQVVHHWSALAERLPDHPLAALLSRGADQTRNLLHELAPATAAYDLHGQPAAQGAGLTLSRQRTGLRDRFLEVNQAARFAVEDLQHVVTLLGYLDVLTRARGHADLADLMGRWERKLRRLENEVRRAVAEIGADPDHAIGTVGEWIDRKAAGRRKDEPPA